MSFRSLTDLKIFLIFWVLSIIIFLAPVMLYGLSGNIMPAAWMFSFQLLMPESYMRIMVVFLGAVFLGAAIAAAITYCIATARQIYEIVWVGGYRDPLSWIDLAGFALVASVTTNAVYA